MRYRTIGPRTARIVERQIKSEHRAFSRLALNVDRSAVRPRDPCDEAQSQPQTFLRRRLLARPADAVKAVKNVGQMLGRDALSGIFHPNDGFIIPTLQHYANFAAGRRELDCIRQQI